ncbi:MAG: acyl carrier protein [Firmicutes bacterium]|nr:acyl carrier protein [Bacillota bacterium]
MTFDTIKAIIADKLDINPEQITMESGFDDMKVDSLYMVEIMLSIEEAFGITIDEAEGMNTVADLVAYVENKLQK